MAENASSVYKFGALRHMDEYFAAGPDLAARLDASAARLATKSSLGAGPSTGVGDDPMAHFTEHWLGGTYFPDMDADRLEAVIRDGFTAAVAAASAAKLPLQTVWVSSPGKDDFRVDHVVGPNAVNVVIVTPVPNR